MVAKYTKLKSATAAIIRRRDEIDTRVDAERKALAAVNADLETALATNQDAGIWGGRTEEDRRKLRKAWLGEQRATA